MQGIRTEIQLWMHFLWILGDLGCFFLANQCVAFFLTFYIKESILWGDTIIYTHVPTYMDV